MLSSPTSKFLLPLTRFQVAFEFALSFKLLAFSYPVFGVKLSRPLEKKPFSGEKQKAVGVQLLSCTDNGVFAKNEKPGSSPVGNGSRTGLLFVQELQRSSNSQDTVPPWLNARKHAELS